jgi:hypothetical protein
MKHQIMVAALIPACFALACGTKKNEKKMPVEVVKESSDSTVPDENDPHHNRCDHDDVSQSQSCVPLVPVGELRIVKESSWLNPEFDRNGRLLDDEGRCLEKFTAGRKNEYAMAELNMKLKNMDLKNQAARCYMQIQVAYTKGYAFAIRKVEAPIEAEIPVDSRAVFEGSYGINGKKPVVLAKSLDTRSSDKSLILETSVADRDIVWSSCSGQATLLVDTELSIESSRSGPAGDIRITGKSPYQMEIVWARCQ